MIFWFNWNTQNSAWWLTPFNADPRHWQRKLLFFILVSIWRLSAHRCLATGHFWPKFIQCTFGNARVYQNTTTRNYSNEISSTIKQNYLIYVGICTNLLALQEFQLTSKTQTILRPWSAVYDLCIWTYVRNLSFRGQSLSKYWNEEFSDRFNWLQLYIWSPFLNHGLTLVPAWISNYMRYKVWDKITYPFPNFNCCTIEVWE